MGLKLDRINYGLSHKLLKKMGQLTKKCPLRWLTHSPLFEKVWNDRALEKAFWKPGEREFLSVSVFFLLLHMIFFMKFHTMPKYYVKWAKHIYSAVRDIEPINAFKVVIFWCIWNKCTKAFERNTLGIPVICS